MILNLENTRTKKQKARMEEAKREDICPFCPVGLKKIHKLPIEFEYGGFFATKNAFAYDGTDFHYLIIPRRHINDITELNDNDWISVGRILKEVLTNQNSSSGGFFLRFGDMTKTGSSIEHLHFQVLSGTKSETDEDRKSLKVKLGYF